MDVAILGCGFIGELIADAIVDGSIPVRLKILFDRNEDKVKRIQEQFDEPPVVEDNIEGVVASDVDLVIEAASIEAVKSFAEPILSSGKDMMIMSVGAFSDHNFYKRVERLCRKTGAKVFLPSGALGALDAIASAAVGELEEVELTTIKNPTSLEGAPYITDKGIDLSNVKE
jgi:aspartate dehydrogenase